jgi:hypothetical protein
LRTWPWAQGTITNENSCQRMIIMRWQLSKE